MKIISFIPAAAYAFFLAASPASAALFTNTNTACESRDVVCSSVTGDVNCSYDAVSVACRNIAGAADFNGDGFQDCVLASGYGTDGVSRQISILNNNGGTPVCGVAGGQFHVAEDHQLSGILSSTSLPLTNVVAGSLNQGVTDIALGFASADLTNPSLAQVLNPLESYGNDESVLNTVDVNWAVSTQDSVSPFVGQRSLRLLNCNADGNLDAVIVAESLPAQTEPEVRINLLKNNGSGLQSAVDSFLVTTFENDGSKTLTVADFDGDGDTDVAVAVGDSETPDSSKIVICRNDGNCNYACDAPIVLNQTQENPLPTSIAAGDFDGDGDKDLAITTPGYTNGSAGVLYFLNNGSGSFTAGPSVAFGDQTREPFALEAGCFNNDKTEDLAVTHPLLPNPGAVISVPTVGGDLKVVTLTTSLVQTVNTLAYHSTNAVLNGYGLDVGNFHDSLSGKYTNGDDIMAVGSEFVPNDSVGTETQRAFIFMNTAEVLSADAGVDRTIDLNESINLSGVCKLTPSDASDVIDAEWSVVGGNASNTVLQNGTSLSPTFHATAAGTYTVRLRCVTTCGRVIADDTVQIVVRGGLSTSGGCASNSLLSGVEGSSRLGGAFGMLMLSLALMFGVRSFRKNQ